MKKFIKIYFIVLIIFILISISSLVVFADENVQSEVENSTKEETNLDKLQNQKSELEANLEASNSQMELVESELSDILIKIEEISLSIIEKNNEIDKLTQENKELDTYIKNVQKDLENITEKYNNNKAVLDKRLIASYEMGQTSYLDMLLTSDGLINFISNYYLISEIVEKDEELVKQCSSAKKYMEELESSLEEKSKLLDENKKTIQKSKISLENMQALKNRRLEELNDTEKNLYIEIESYQNEIQSVEREIKLLAMANIGESYIGGMMAWPVPGYTRITSQFGMRTHPITGIYKLHTGVDIGAPMGTTFVAANDGVVTKADYNSAYGNMVIIDHGGGVTTLYAHGSEILVQVGDTVTQGTPVLSVGSTGYSTGPHAHFEVRINGEYQNPLDYITSYNNTNNSKENNVEQVVVEQ